MDATELIEAIDQVTRGLNRLRAVFACQHAQAAGEPDEWPPTDPDFNDGNWISAQQAAGEIHLHERTIYRLAEENEFGIKVFGRWWINRPRFADFKAGRGVSE